MMRPALSSSSFLRIPLFLVLLFGIWQPLRAGGPLVVDPTANTPFRWQGPVNFIIDNGPLGSLSRDQGADLVRQAFQKWVKVPNSSLSVNDLGFLSQDINASNYQQFFGLGEFGPRKERPENPIVFDSDGGIIDDLLGAGSKNSVLGFAGARFIDMANHRFRSAWAVLNGTRASLFGSFPIAVLHELGHLLGLDHSQINWEPFLGQFRPVMFPTLGDDAPADPMPDDQAWLAWLYPGPDFATATASIRGRIFRRTGQPFQGANVVAVKVTPDAEGRFVEPLKDRYSVVSDFLIKGDGSYELPLPPGFYVVFIEPLRPSFTEGSRVGPFDHRFTNFEKDYYNGENESGAETPQQRREEKTLLEVAGGQVLEGINLISDEFTNQLERLTDDDSMQYDFPAGFSFPFFGKVYTSVIVNSDGNLTFGQGDSASTARDQERFLSGPPRIAPLFADLDPSRGGRVRATEEADRITFTWDEVPQFSDEGSRPGNRFSVTLFSNGDILFQYEKVDLLPDSIGGTQAVVGVTPGNNAPGNSQSLSSLPSPIPLENTPVFQTFFGNSFNLVGKEIRFQAPQVVILFPFLRGNDQSFTGFALTNFGEADASLEVEGRGKDGNLLPLPKNPSHQVLAGKKQLARLGSELFEGSLAAFSEAWVRILSSHGDVGSFFLFGTGGTGPITQMDGSQAFREGFTELFFTRLFEGPATFPSNAGPRDAETWISLVNPGTETITLQVELYAAPGQLLANTSRQLPPLGCLFQRVSVLLNLNQPQLSDGYLRVKVSGGKAIGFQLIQLADTLIGLNAASTNDKTKLFSAQLANGVAAGIATFTNLKVVNTSNSLRAVTLRAIRADGTEIGNVPNVILNPNQTLQRDVGQLFRLGPNTSPATVGSLIVEADGPGIVGDVIFGDPLAGAFAAALPLQSILFTKAVFSQVANGQTNPNDPSTDTFTGLAFFNSNGQAVQIKVEVFNAECQLIGEASLVLEAGRRFSDLVENLVPESANLNRGYILVTSDLPLVAQQLFGNVTLQFLAAVPATVIQAAQP